MVCVWSNTASFLCFGDAALQLDPVQAWPTNKYANYVNHKQDNE